MISMIGAIARLAFVVIATTVCLPIAASRAQTYNFAYVSDTGTGTACTVAQPCGSLGSAFAALDGNNGRIVCLSPVNFTSQGAASSPNTSNQTVEIDCPAGMFSEGMFWSSNVSNVTVKIRNVTFTNLGNASAIGFFGSGTLILENCIVESSITTALDIEPNSQFNLVMTNSRISNNSTVAVVLKPAAGGSINATFDHVTVTKNGGGGIRLDTTNGPVTADVTDSVITNNTGNGLSAQGGVGSVAMLSIHDSVIAKNGAAGINATGTNGAVLVDTTLLDTNGTATSIASGGRIVSYGNNRVVGPAGTGFTGTASLQ